MFPDFHQRSRLVTVATGSVLSFLTLYRTFETVALRRFGVRRRSELTTRPVENLQ
jgi:hypothetical protein